MILAEAMQSYFSIADVDEANMGAVLVADDRIALKLLASFRLVALPVWREPRSAMPADANGMWRWMWSGYTKGPDAPTFLERLAAAAGVSEQVAYRRWPAIMASRLVYPDGQLSDIARSLLMAFVASTLPKMPKVTDDE